jgi:3-phosphoshikimate 1-carboxyvinyltransferase
MRLLCGVLASCAFESRLVGDRSLSARPMERVAAPLRAMGAEVVTTQGRPPVRVLGGSLRGITHRPEAPSAQVKGAVLLAGLEADGPTWVTESARTRDHTERALEHLGATVHHEGLRVGVEPCRHGGFSGTVPGDVSSAAFLLAAAVVTGSSVTVRGVGLNPTRTAFLDVLRRMGVRVEVEVEREELGEPVGTIGVAPPASIDPTEVSELELPLVIDEVLVLAAVAAHASGPTRFRGAGELRLKEVDRLSVTAEAFRGIGAEVEVERDDLVVVGGGVYGGRAGSGGDHRLAMALVVAALGATGPVEVEGMEAADVSFPGFVTTVASLGGVLEP